MSTTVMTLCVLCFKRVLGCSECDDCDANRYCAGHYFLRARQRGTARIEGGLFQGLSDEEFVRLVNEAVSMRRIRTF